MKSFFYKLTKDTQDLASIALGAGFIASLPILTFGKSAQIELVNMFNLSSVQFLNFNLYLITMNILLNTTAGRIMIVEKPLYDVIGFLFVSLLFSILCGIILAKIYKKKISQIILRRELYVVPIICIFALIVGTVVNLF